MIRFLIYGLLMACGLSAIAQENIFEKGKYRIYDYTYIDYRNNHQRVTLKWKMEAVRDTVIDGMNGSVVSFKCPEKPDFMLGDSIFVILEHDGVVMRYEIQEPYGEPKTSLMNFNVKPGDILDVYEGGDVSPSLKLRIINEKIMNVEGIDRKAIGCAYVGTSEAGTAIIDQPSFYWVEGIGSPSLEYITLYPVPSDGSSFNLSEVWQGDKLIFSREKWLKSNGVEAVRAEAATDGRIYDMQGREVKQPQPGRIYIQGARKLRK